MVANDMSVIDHLNELRKRILIVVTCILIASIIVYYKAPDIVNFLLKPIDKFKLDLAYFNIMDGFITRLKVAVFGGLIFASPVILYHLSAFINPGLTKKEKKILYTVVVSLSITFVGGAVFGYVMVLPHTLNFLIAYGKNYLVPMLSGNRYVSFVVMFCLVSGIMVSIPCIIVILSKVGIVNYNLLKKIRKFVIIALISIEGLILPAFDLMTFILLGAPMILLYEGSIWIVYFIDKKRKKKEALLED